VWWEGVILLRKAALVVLAMVVTEPFYQVVLAVLLFATATVLQQHMLPYSTAAFNNMETAMLATLYITAAASTLLLPTTVGFKVSALSASFTDSISIVVLVLNLATTAALGGAVAWHACSSVTVAVRSRTTKQKVMARRPSVVPRLTGEDVAAGSECALPLAAAGKDSTATSAVDDRSGCHQAAGVSAPTDNVDQPLRTPTAVDAAVDTSSAAGAVSAIRQRRVLQAAAASSSDIKIDDTGAEMGRSSSGAGADSNGTTGLVDAVDAVPSSRCVRVPVDDVLAVSNDTAGGAVVTAVAAEAVTVTQLSRVIVVDDTHKVRASARLAPQLPVSRRDNRRAVRGDAGGDVGVWR